MSEVRPVRVVVKALVLFAMANLAFAYFNPAIGRLSIFNHLVNGRLRFPVSTQNMDALFASHVISAGPKPANEYRVILLGDSSVWGFTLLAPDILSEQINRMDLVTCAGKTVKAYDLAYPLPSFMRDLLILDKARQYHPDLIVWSTTMEMFLPDNSEMEFLVYQPDRVMQLVKNYDLKVPDASNLKISSFWEKTILGQRARIKVAFTDQLDGLHWAATGVDVTIMPAIPLADKVSASSTYHGFAPADLTSLVATFQFSAFDAGRKLAGNVPIYYFNEPMFITSGKNSSIRYNSGYPRWAYDEYRTRIGQWMKEQNLPYDDFWNIIPPSEFTDSPLHLMPEGERQLAARLAPAILNLACK